MAGLSVLILPSPISTTADLVTFSVRCAMVAINRLVDEPHSVLCREAHDRARDGVVDIFSDLGYTPTVYSDPLFDLSSPRAKEIFDVLSAEQQAEFKDTPAETIVVGVPGKSERTTALMAHYDSAIGAEPDGDSVCLTAGDSHGAGDDDYGVTVIVEALRAPKAEGCQPENSLEIVIIDAGEVDLLGAANEMRHHRADYENVDLVLNPEARGTNGPALMFETFANNSAVAGYFLSHVKQSAASSLFPSLYACMPNLVGMTVLVPEGLTVLNIAAIGNAEHYCHATDAPRYVDHSTVQHHDDQALGLTRTWALDGQAPTSTANGDLHFLQLQRGLTVRYPAAVGTGLSCLAVTAAPGAITIRARSPHRKRVLGSVQGPIRRTVSVSAVAGLLQRGAMAMGWTPIYGVGPNPLLMWMFADGALIGAGLTAHLVMRRWKEGIGQETLAAVLLLLATVCVSLMVLVPGTAHVLVFTMPALVLTALASKRVRPVVGAPAVFISVVISAPIIPFIHKMLSLGAVWVTVFFMVVPVALLALVFLQAGSWATARTSSSSDAAPDGAATADRAVVMVQDGAQETAQEATAASTVLGPLLVSGLEVVAC